MIYRLFLSFVLIAAFTIENHLAPGGLKISLDFSSFSNFIISILFTWSWILFWDLLPTRIQFKKFFVPFFAALLALLHYFELNSGGKLEAGVLLDNWASVFNFKGMQLVGILAYERFVAANFFWSIVIAGMFFLTYKTKDSNPPALLKQKRFTYPSMILPFILLSVLCVKYAHSFEPFSGLARGVTERWIESDSQLVKLAKKLKPELPATPVLKAISPATKPNIVLVFIESLSSSFVETKSPAGVPYMPILNSLIPKGLYFDKHYSVSVQTARSQFAALCGKLPIYQGLESYDYYSHDFDCLPKYLNQQGYSTVFIQAYGDPNFDNKTIFYKHQGYHDVPQVAKTCKDEKNVPCWNWGIQDDEFYRRSIQEIKKYKEPFFLTLTTVTSHAPFAGTPEKLIVHFKQPKNRFENYVNTLSVADNALEVLFEQLEQAKLKDNTVVIIMGDHGFPMGQHSNFHNENYAYEENFRVPLLILDLRKDSQLKGRVSTTTSHLNLPGAILALTGHTGPTSFQGASLFEVDPETNPIPLVQPYSGILLGSVRWPYKYLFEKRTRREWVFNLEVDPQEKQSLEMSSISESLKDKFHHDVATIIWNNINRTKK